MTDLQIYHDLEQRTELWYQLRCGIVTASTVGKLITPTLKVANNETSRRVIDLLAAERITGHVEPTATTADMWRGVEAEPYARDLYAKHHAEVVECGFMVRNHDNYRIGYSPDGLVGDNGLIEIKAPRPNNHLTTIIHDRVPAHYWAQCQTGLLVSGRDWLDFVSYCGGMPLYVKRVLPDPKWQAAILAAVEQAEEDITATVATYQQAITGLPPTERITNLDELVF